MDTNHDTLEFGIREILKYDFKVNLKIITHKLEKIRIRLGSLNLKNISLEFIEWNKEMDKEVLKTDIVIIPYLNDHKRIVKSYNRIIDSISLGRFTIISDLSHLRKFKNYCFLGNIGAGLKWAKENNILAIEKVKGSPLNQKFERYANMTGFVLLIILMIVVTWRDIIRVF